MQKGTYLLLLAFKKYSLRDTIPLKVLLVMYLSMRKKKIRGKGGQIGAGRVFAKFGGLQSVN